MNRIITKCLALLFLLATTLDSNAAVGRGGTRGRKQVAKESPAMHVEREMSVVDKIVAKAKIIANATQTTPHKTIATAIADLKKLMKDKELDQKIKDVIVDDINIILAMDQKSADSRKKARQALQRIIANVNTMNAQAKIVKEMEEGRKAIELAPDDMKDIVIAQRVQKVQAAEAEAEQAGIISRTIAGVKSALAAPGNYFFGEERTAAKTLFEVAVGAIVAGGTAYAAYKYAPTGVGTQMQGWYEAAKAKLGFGAKPAEAAPKVPFGVQEEGEYLFPTEPGEAAPLRASKYRKTPEETLEFQIQQQEQLGAIGGLEAASARLTSERNELVNQINSPGVTGEQREKLGLQVATIDKELNEIEDVRYSQTFMGKASKRAKEWGNERIEQLQEWRNRASGSEETEKPSKSEEVAGSESSREIVSSPNTPEQTRDLTQLEESLKTLEAQQALLLEQNKTLPAGDPQRQENVAALQLIEQQINAQVEAYIEAHKNASMPRQPSLRERFEEARKWWSPESKKMP